MLLHDYRCEREECGFRFESLQGLADPCPPCPVCGFSTAKMVSRASFVLKGTGWARDGYSSSGGGNG